MPINMGEEYLAIFRDWVEEDASQTLVETAIRGSEKIRCWVSRKNWKNPMLGERKKSDAG